MKSHVLTYYSWAALTEEKKKKKKNKEKERISQVSGVSTVILIFWGIPFLHAATSMFLKDEVGEWV